MMPIGEIFFSGDFKSIFTKTGVHSRIAVRFCKKVMYGNVSFVKSKMVKATSSDLFTRYTYTVAAYFNIGIFQTLQSSTDKEYLRYCWKEDNLGKKHLHVLFESALIRTLCNPTPMSDTVGEGYSKMRRLGKKEKRIFIKIGSGDYRAYHSNYKKLEQREISGITSDQEYLRGLQKVVDKVGVNYVRDWESKTDDS